MLPQNPRRLLTHGALALSAGIFVGVRLAFHMVWPAALAASLVLTMLLHIFQKPVWPGFLFCFFFLGLGLCAYRAHPALPPEGKYQVTAKAMGEAKIREEDGRIALYLRDAILTGETGEEYKIGKLYWTYWPEEEDARVPLDGQTVAFSGKIYHPDGRENPYGFDFRLYLLQKGVKAGISGAADLLITPEGQTQPADPFLRLRNSISARLELLLSDQAPLAKALLIGETEGMPQDMRDGFRRAGVAHVLSVSGLHAMIIMGVVIALLDRAQASPGVTFGVTLVFLTAYCALTGANAPILRAAILVMYQMYARIVRRRGDALSSWALGLIILLLIQPLELFSAGFQMSFGAVLGMIMLGDALRPLLERIGSRRIRSVVSAYAVTLCATLGTALPAVHTYNRLSLVGLLINPLVCFVTEVLMLLFAALLLFSLISLPLAMKAGALLRGLSRVTVEGVGAAGAVDWSSLHVASPKWYIAAAVVLCLLLCTRYIEWKWQKRALCGLLSLAMAFSAAILTQNRDVRYIQLAMGNADAAVIEDGSETIVIDTGEYGGDLSSYLLATGRRADHLILTHLHTDHALGLEYLLDENVPIGCVYIPTEAFRTEVSPGVITQLMRLQTAAVPVRLISAGDIIATPRVEIAVRWPEKGTGHALKDANDSAAGLMIHLDGVRMLHMSDITGSYERYAADTADILRAAHHGSASSTGAAFLAAVSPRVCLISGDNPSEKTLARLAQAAIMVYDTGAYGAITVTAREGQYTVQGYLQ